MPHSVLHSALLTKFANSVKCPKSVEQIIAATDNLYYSKAQNIYLTKYPVLPGAAIYPAADLDGLSWYVRAPYGSHRYRLKPCLCGGTTSTRARNYAKRHFCRRLSSAIEFFVFVHCRKNSLQAIFTAA